MASLDFNAEADAFITYYNENLKVLETAAEYFRSLINSILLQQVPIQSVVGRLKHRDECISKFKRKYQKGLEDKGTSYEIVHHITDLIGIRVVCLYEPDIQNIKNILEQNFEVLEITDKIKDIDSTQDKFGYKSLHLDLKLDERRRGLPENKQYSNIQFEVQIRTIIQDAWSVLDHKIQYKKNIPDDLKRRINRLAAMFELGDDEFHSIKADTERFVEEAKSNINKPNQPLNIFSFLESVSPIFPSYLFITERADSFVHEILELSPTITKEQFQKAVKDNLTTIKKYNSEIVFSTPTHYLNPYTMIRHCLYLYDKEVFKEILFDGQRNNFDQWLEINKM